MKYCEDCGYECSDDAKFCGLCGFAFGEMSVDAEELEKAEEHEESEKIEQSMEADKLVEADEEKTEEEKTEEEKTEEENPKEEIGLVETEEDTTETVENEEAEEPAEPDTKEYYKQQMLQNKKMIDDLMEQQRQMKLQMQTMQQQQWNQTQQQQRQQKMINYYNNQISEQRMLAQTQSKGIAIRNIWSLVAAVVCLLPFFINSFIKFNSKYYDGRCGFVEYCREVTYGSVDSFSEWITSMLPIFVLVLIVILIIGAYKAVHKVRGWVVIINIIAIIVTFFYVNAEESSSTSFGISFWILALGIGLAAYSCCTDNTEVDIRTRALSYDDMQGPAYSLSMLAADSSLELKQEWRCPKCDSKNPIDYRYCKTCSTARS